MAGIKIPSSRLAPATLNPVGAEQTPLALAKRGTDEGLAAGLKSAARSVSGISSLRLADEAVKREEDSERLIRIAEGKLNASDRKWHATAIGRKGRDALPGSGPDAKGVTADTVIEYQRSFDEVAADLSPEQREALADRMFSRREASLDQYSGHESAQAIFVDAQLSKAAKGNAILRASDNFADEEALGDSALTIAMENLRVPGVIKEIAELNTKVDVSKMLRDTSKLLAEQDPAAARERLDRKLAEGSIGAVDYQNAMEHVDTQRVHQSSSTWVDNNWSRLKQNGGDLTLRELQDIARDIFKDDVAMKDEVVKRLSERNTSDKKSKEDVQRGQNDSDYTTITKLKADNNLYSARLVAMLNPDPVFQEKMRAFINDVELVTDTARNNELIQMARDPDQKAEFLRIDPMHEPLATRERNKLYDMIAKVGRGEAIGEIAIAADMALIVQQTVERENYGKLQARRTFVRLEEEIAVFFELKKRNPNAGEMRDMANSLTARVDWQLATNQPAVASERGDFSDFDAGLVLELGITAVPYNLRPELRARLRRMKPNQTVTNAQVVKLFIRDFEKANKKLENQ